MWLAGLLILHLSRQNGDGKDIWGWACKNGVRKEIFKDQVAYDVVCRMQVCRKSLPYHGISSVSRPSTNSSSQQWSLVCAAIEITVELLTISVYAIVFYRYYTRKQLQKAMESRDQARSDLYLAHLRLQSAPSSPGFLTRQASFRAQQQGQAQVQSQTVVVGQDAYVNLFMTPALFTGQPLLGGFGRVVEEEEEKEEEGKEAVKDTRVTASPGPTTTCAAPQAKPFVLSAAPKKGKRSAQQSPQTSSATSPSHFSPATLHPTYKDNRPFSFSPPVTATASTPARQPTQFLPLRDPSVAEPSAVETSRPASTAWPHSPSVMPAAPGELAFEHVPIPGAYGTVSPLPSPGLYGPETVMGGMFV